MSPRKKPYQRKKKKQSQQVLKTGSAERLNSQHDPAKENIFLSTSQSNQAIASYEHDTKPASLPGPSMGFYASQAKLFASLLKKGPWLATSIFCWIVILVVWLYARRPTASDFSTLINFTGQLELSYKDSQRRGISPMCGCLFEQQANNWRGISFLGNLMQITRTKEKEASVYTNYQIFPAATSTFPLAPGPFGFRAHVYRLFVNEPHVVNLGDFSGPLPDWYKELSPPRVMHHLASLMLVTNQPLHIGLLASKPFAAWIPIRGSRVLLSEKQPLFASDEKLLFLEEKYQEETADPTDSDYPFLDLLSQKIVLSVDDPNAILVSMNDVGNEILDPQKDNGQNGAITVIVIEGSFSTRVVPFEFDYAHRDATISSIRNSRKPVYGMSERDNATIHIDIASTMSQDEYNHVFQAVHDNPTDLEPMIESPNPAVGGIINISEMRFPPVPPFKGVTIYGQLDRFRFNSATGVVSTKGVDHEIKAPNSIELRSIGQLNNKKQVGLDLTLDGSQSAEHTTMELAGKAEVFLGNKTLTQHFDTLTDIYSLITALALSLAFLANLKKLLSSHK